MRTNSEDSNLRYIEKENLQETNKKSKRDWIDDEITEIEIGQSKNTKKFYQKINNQNEPYMQKWIGIRHKKGKVEMGGNLLKETWTACFTDLRKDEET